MLAIARALIAEPEVLLLDEAAAIIGQQVAGCPRMGDHPLFQLSPRY